MKAYYIVVFTLVLFFLSTAKVSAVDISISRVSAHIEGDSLCIEMKLDVSAVKVTQAVAFTFTPILQNRGKLMVLPAVVVTGKRRAKFDRREVLFSTPEGYKKPLYTIYGNSKERRNVVDYKILVPYGLWMEHASLSLMQEVKDCCDMQLLGVEKLIQDLAITGIAILTQGETYWAATGTEKVNTGRGIITPCPPSPYTDMVSYLEPDMEAEKHRTGSATLYIDYLTDRYELQPGYKRNKKELQKLDSLMSPLRNEEKQAHIENIRICGYASPEGSYEHNEALSSNRARYFMNYMLDTYRLHESFFDVSWVPEDWSTLTRLVKQKQPFGYREILDVIRAVPTFDRREKILKGVLDGKPYAYLRESIYPLLRRIEVTVNYNVDKVTNEQAAELIYTRPQMLSLQEMYRVARYYRPGTEQYREIYEIAAHHFPDDAVANINAASAEILTGDLVSARNYLQRYENDARAWNNLGVLAFIEEDMEKAAEWFRKALGVEPHKARKNLRMAEEALKQKQNQ